MALEECKPPWLALKDHKQVDIVPEVEERVEHDSQISVEGLQRAMHCADKELPKQVAGMEPIQPSFDMELLKSAVGTER